MSFRIEVVGDAGSFPAAASARIAASVPPEGSIVLTGGTTAAAVYRALARQTQDWSRLQVFFSDERCVPPDDPRSNFRMATETLLDHIGLARVHRMRGEDPPEEGAAAYDRALTATVGMGGFDLVLLGMGADCHVGAIYPGSGALEARSLCAAVDRPDGMQGLTLTPRALRSAHKILLIVAGHEKAEAVGRAVEGHEPRSECPARLLADHEDATFLLDEDAAARLSSP